MTKQYDLSILIPARNEMFVARTVQDIIEHKEGNTQVIVALDGAWAEPGIMDHPDVVTVFIPESIGQRAATNLICKLSNAKYVMKCDAHCAFDQGFDRKLMEAIQGHDNWTIVPNMKNLHAFDWVCDQGHRRYQGPSGDCTECGLPTTRDVIWYAKPSPNSTSYRFDKTMHFQYFGEFGKRPEGRGDITPTLSLQGSCFMLTREKYWELDICDEKHGSWGQQGVEVALKTWLSGGEVMCVQTTWYAHMFRTQGGDFSFPYPNPEREVRKAREYSRDLWLNDKWDKAIHPLQWLIDKFAPVPDWDQTNKGIIFYTDNQLKLSIAHAVQRQLRSVSKSKGIPIVSSSLKPMDKMGKNIHIKEKRGVLTMYKQILSALEASDAEIIYFCEHDVLYHPTHFDFVPPEKNKFYYNHAWWSIREDGFAVHWDANRVSQLVAYKDHAIAHYRAKVKEIEDKGHNGHYEPGGRDVAQYGVFSSAYPNIDIRHKGTLTKDKWSKEDFRDKNTCINWQESDVYSISGWEKETLMNIYGDK